MKRAARVIEVENVSDEAFKDLKAIFTSTNSYTLLDRYMEPIEETTPMMKVESVDHFFSKRFRYDLCQDRTIRRSHRSVRI